MSRLKTSERNSLIEDFRNGIVNKDYEVIQSKTAKGKFTIRKRSKPLTDEEIANPEPTEEPEEPVEVEAPKKKGKSKIKITNKNDPSVLFLQNMLQVQVMKRLDDLEFWKNKTKMKKQIKKQNKRQAEQYEVVEEVEEEPEPPKPLKQLEDPLPPEEPQEGINIAQFDYDALYNNRIDYSKFGF